MEKIISLPRGIISKIAKKLNTSPQVISHRIHKQKHADTLKLAMDMAMQIREEEKQKEQLYKKLKQV